MALRFIKNILPDTIIVLLKKIRRSHQRNKILNKKKKGQIFTIDDLISDLKKCNFSNSETVMVHTKLSSIGYVEGGANTFIKALCIVLDVENDGTLLMPSFPMTQLSEKYFESSPIFDVINTPSAMGRITEVFRLMPGVLRSLHPSHPVLAYGKKKEFLLQSHFKQRNPFNKNSPFYKLVEVNGKILVVGLKMSQSLTNLHVIEDLIPDFRPKVYLNKIFNVKVIDYDRQEHDVELRVHDSKVSLQRKCDDLEAYFISKGVIQNINIGNAGCMLIDAKLLLETLRDLYNKNISIYNPEGI